MGAKQSKRSVDISGKEAEGGGEVAAAGAGGEGRVEQLADADALKPQLNGDVHIQNEQTDKEKELDSGTPENEKDATTEKEGKEEEEKKDELVTNGEAEPKENGDSTPTPEDGKKPKKEKVKKKWSLRSISFSRKDKPKQEKKAKEEEPKTNGEPEKVPEETAESTPEVAANDVAEEAKAPAEEKDEKTPETPVTEPLTNGTSTPESAKAETPASEDAPAASPEPAAAAPAPAAAPAAAPAPAPALAPEQLPVNGLSLEEPKPETPVVEKLQETIPEPPAAETPEIVPAAAPEIPKEVCAERLPLLEPTPPPLPANPPPSSVASFAATTMAPELTDASLANTAEPAPLTALPDAKHHLARPDLPTAVTVTDSLQIELPSVSKEIEETPAVAIDNEPKVKDNEPETIISTDIDLPKQIDDTPKIDIEAVSIETKIETAFAETTESVMDPVQAVAIPEDKIGNNEPIEMESVKMETTELESVAIEEPDVISIISETVMPEIGTVKIDEVHISPETQSEEIVESIVTESQPEPEEAPEIGDDSSLPPPPVLDDPETNLDEVDEKVEESLKQIPEPIADITDATDETDHIPDNEMTNGGRDLAGETETEKLKRKAKQVVAGAAAVGCNGDSRAAPPPPAAPPAAAPLPPQDPLPVSDKLADLIPEVPDVPELNTETLQETVTDVAVAN